MLRLRCTLQDLIAFVGVSACVFAAARTSGDPPLVAAWLALVLLTLGSLCGAIAGIVFRRGAARAFWVGFAGFGWSFIVWFYVFIVFFEKLSQANEMFFSLHLLVFPFAWLGGLICRRFGYDVYE